MSMIKSRIPGFRIDWNEKDIASVSEVIRRGFYWAEGPEIAQFEEALGSMYGGSRVLAVNSGTSAQHLAMMAAIPEGSSVIVPSFTFISTANTVVHAGLKPLFADIESETFGLDADDVNERIDRDTRAIVVMHYAGQVARDTRALGEIAGDRGLLLIEDCAESMGAIRDGTMAGDFGDIAFLSFCQNKIITTGEGGAVLTRDEEIYNKVRVLRSHGRSDPEGRYFQGGGIYTYTEAGYNMRMPSMLAALGMSQLSRVHELIESRRDAAARYLERFRGVEGITVPEVRETAAAEIDLAHIRAAAAKAREEMLAAARALEFERAAELRDRMIELEELELRYR